ncbi:MAG: hypothetical protein M3291_03225 [Actinomycetota bacterium]|nr:hypothetical protein [Actinomycetota bacterium]
MLAIATAVDTGGTGPLSWPAAAAFTAAVVFTIVVNVPINRATGRWDAQHPPADWEPTRNRWEPITIGEHSRRALTVEILRSP